MRAAMARGGPVVLVTELIKELNRSAFSTGTIIEMKTKLTNCLILALCLCTASGIGSSTAKAASPSAEFAETYDSLATGPAGAVELMKGVYQSVMLKQSCSFRVFSPIDPKWPAFNIKDDMGSEGMRLVVYVMNLAGVPRPSAASDREVIEGLIKDDFLVVAVDFAGGRVKDHLELQKDINGLFCVFGGIWHSKQGYFTQNRKTLLEYPGPNADQSYTSFDYTKGTVKIKVPVNRSGIYVIPSGYTVKAHQVIRKVLFDEVDAKRLGGSGKDQFVDIVYPKPSTKTDKVPLLLDATSTGSGLSVVNANTPVLYSWIFNGYAFASVNFISYKKYDTNISALRYLDSEKEQYSLSGRVGTAGISKACWRCYSDSNFKPQKSEVDDLPYGKASNRVQVCMPVAGEFSNFGKSLDANSPALVLSWCALNDAKDKGDIQRAINAAYQKAGFGEKCLYLPSLSAGHEYDVYHLNEIMAYFDKYCKE